MKTEGTNLLLLTISAFWSSFRWPLATLMGSRRQRSIPLCGRYRQVSLYQWKDIDIYEQGVWKFFSASAQSMKPKMFFSFIHFKISASARRAQRTRFSDALYMNLNKPYRGWF